MFAAIAPDGCFQCIEEPTLMLEGTDADPNLGSASTPSGLARCRRQSWGTYRARPTMRMDRSPGPGPEPTRTGPT